MLAAHFDQVLVRVTLVVRLFLVIPRSALPLALDVAHLTDDRVALDKGLAAIRMGAQIVRHSENTLDGGIGRACQTLAPAAAPSSSGPGRYAEGANLYRAVRGCHDGA